MDMAQESVARQIAEPQVVAPKGPGFAGGGPPASPDAFQGPMITNARLGLSMFLASEAMFFAGLIGAFLVFRLSKAAWPPPFQPRLPVAVTGVNTIILLLSGLTMYMAVRAVCAGKPSGLVKSLLATAVLGGIFLSVQGYEWIRLVDYGLTMSSGVYGATFYTLIGCHAFHVLGAVLWLVTVAIRAGQGRYTAQNHTGVELCGMYWTFVVGLWPVLYGLVYLY
jgi:cytochrome c oxidase subunit 3